MTVKILRGIERPVEGERVLASLPPLAPYVGAPEGRVVRKRLNFFTGRALSHLALTAQQRGRMHDAARLARAVAPGVICGLEVALEGAELVLMPGQALTAEGEDVGLHYPLRIHPDRIPLDSASIVTRLAPSGNAADDAIRARLTQGERFTLGALRQAGRLDLLPHALVLVAQPMTIAIDRTGEIDSPCANAVGEGVWSQLAWEDGLRLLWTAWPNDASLPVWTVDGLAVDSRFRNRLAYALFNSERDRADIDDRIRRLRISRNTEWDAARLAEIDAALVELARRRREWPWNTIGAPLALVGFDAHFAATFVDRSAVVSQGGGRANRTPLAAFAGEDVLWQARVAQLIEHLAELPPEERAAAAIARQFDWLPPAGVLPLDAVDIVANRQFIFPASYDVQARPVPIDMVDALISESAAMAPYNLSAPDQVQILIPVPARLFDPELLKLDERIHPLFDAEISRLELLRSLVLTQRDRLRRRFDALSHAISGRLPAYPQDDPDALPDETGALDAMAFARVHRTVFTSGKEVVHAFRKAQTWLELAATDELFVFVRLDTRPAAITLQAFTGDAARQLIYWGDGAPPANAVNAGPLPEGEGWVRLSVPVAAAGLSVARIDGMAFGVIAGAASGEVQWGYAGKMASGYESYWVSDALPHGAITEALGAWDWREQGDAAADGAGVADAVNGLALQAHSRHVVEIDTLVENYTGYRGGVLKGELGVPSVTQDATGAPLTAPAPNPPLAGCGLDDLISRLDARIAAANDHIEFGFLRARTDIFRVRQSVLGVENAGRLLTSPAAAELITRNDNPVATEKDFAEYFKRAAQTPTAPSGDALRPASAVTPSAPASATFVAMSTTARTSMLAQPGAPLISALTFGGASSSSNSSIDAMMLRTLPTDTIATAATTTSLNADAMLALQPTLTATEVAKLALDTGPSLKEVAGTSLYGATLNTITVGERLTGSAAVIAKNAAASGKSDFVQNGASLLAEKGFAIDDLPVFGYKTQAGVSAQVTAASLIQGKLEDTDAEEPAGADVAESVYFQRGLDAIDNMVRFLRGVELRVEDYKRLQGDAVAARSRIVSALQRIERQIADLSIRLAEARHDLSVARALRAEEVERVAALIARRKAILAEHVPYVVFRRPRLTHVLLDAPVRAIEPALIEDPVPRCRQDAHEAPPELQAMVQTLKDVPAAWFRRLKPLVLKFDRIDSLQQLVTTATQRIAAQQPRKLELLEAAQTKTGLLLNNAFARQAQRLELAAQQQSSALSLIKADTWKSGVEAAAHVIAAADLIHGAATDRQVTLEAAGELDDIAGVANCLYLAFCSVPPAARLQWAERFSQTDPNVSLRVLTVLPGFADERLGVDYIAWKQMQRMVDWLFSRVVDEPQAVAAINDLVHVALLLAAHAPVRRIISARIRKPVRPLIDARLDLEIDPRVVRIGMQVLVHAPTGGAPVARAVVEDLAADGAVARIAEVMQPAITIDATMRVQLQSGAALTTVKTAQIDAAKAVQEVTALLTPARAKAGVAQGGMAALRDAGTPPAAALRLLR